MRDLKIENKSNKHKFNLNVLVFPGGTEIGLEISRSLRYCKGINIFSASDDSKNHSEFFYAKSFFIPSVKLEEECLEKLIYILKENEIDLIYPANPIVIDFLNKKRSLIPSKIVMASKEVLSFTRSKKKTYDKLKNVIPIPKIYEGDPNDYSYPVFIKPDSLYGSQGTRIIRNVQQYNLDPKKDDEICTEYLPGEEYTIDCFSDQKNELLFAGVRTRERIRMGTSMHCEPVKNNIKKILIKYANLIQNEFRISGGWFFQVKRSNDDKLVLLEVEARVAGTMAFHRVQGVNIPLLSIYDLYDMKYKVCFKEIKNLKLDRSLHSRFLLNDIKYKTVYIDLDDTIIIKKKINIQIISFLYQCINDGKRIILISKSLHPNPNQYLKELKIDKLFDKVHWLKEDEKKSSYIKDDNSIFIDDSFSQREEVEVSKGIFTLDPFMVETLIEENVF